MNNILYIGLHGYAGSGKDTVAKMLYCILNFDKWNSKEEAYNFYVKNYNTLIAPYATLNNNDNDKYCTCIAFADKLKELCSVLFGVPLKYFYYNKSNSWLCINKDFEYTENEPNKDFIITAEDYFYCKDKYLYEQDKYYMSLREILVYVGTYILQYNICKNVFVNSVKNNIKQITNKYDNKLSYVICTDVRFLHEYNFIRDNTGIMIDIVRDDVIQNDDIAEHELDEMDESDYDFTIYNNSTYEDLFYKIYDIVNSNEVFSNSTINLYSELGNYSNSYIRKIKEIYKDTYEYKLSHETPVMNVSHINGKISFLQLKNGPMLNIGDIIENYIIECIEFNDYSNSYIITLSKIKTL